MLVWLIHGTQSYNGSSEGESMSPLAKKLESKNRNPRITILGMGNVFSSDDGVGALIVRGLDVLHLAPSVRTIIAETPEMGLFEYFLDSDVVIVLDTIAADTEPGTIFRFHAHDDAVKKLQSNGDEKEGLLHLIRNAKQKGVDPEVVVYGIQGQKTGIGYHLSGPVRAAAGMVCSMVEEEIRRRLNGERFLSAQRHEYPS